MPPHTKSYKAVLNAFLSHRDQVQYPKDYDFEDAILNGIQPEEVVAYFNWKAFGTENPGDDDAPVRCRSSSLHFYKKAISFYIPNKHKLWDVETLRGNATKSPQVNAVIKRVKKAEVRAEGVAPQARRELTQAEFRLIIRIAEKNISTNSLKLRLPTMAKFQLHLIARIDDTAHVRFADLKSHPQFNFALTIRLRWTKNCNEERDAPEQIILGSEDSDFCVVVALAIYIQFALEFANAHNSDYIFCNTEETPTSIKQQVSVMLKKKVIESGEWQELQRRTHGENYTIEKCGTHSLRKFAATLARLLGRSQDEVDVRGRWRNTKRVSDRYTSINLPIVDANVASSLCVGGAVKYKIKEDSPVSDAWLIEEFVPQIALKCGNGVAIVLGRALLWALIEPTMSSLIPEELRHRLQWRYMGLHPDAEMLNPIEKAELVVYEVSGQLHIDEVGEIERGVGDEAAAGGGGVAGNHPSLTTVIAQNNALRGQNQEIIKLVRDSNETMKSEIRLVKKVLHKVANRPAQITRTINLDDNVNIDNNNDDTVARIAAPAEFNYVSSLSASPSNLYELWEEYEFGREGRKAAKLFNLRERGRNKYKYHRRKVVWDKIAQLIRRGHTYHTAIEEIYRVYGPETPVTEIINRMRRDRATGGHPSL